MTERSQSESSPLEHLATGVPGLDEVLRGGIFPGGVYILQGGPGAGKTILANHICYNWAAAGKRSLYVTLLAETHHRLLRYLQSMRFFDPRHAADAVFYESGFDTLKREGLEGVLDFLRRNGRERDASLVVLDGLFVLEETAHSEREFREFINDIAVLADMVGCAILLLTNSKRSSGSPEYTMVDGWIELDMMESEYRTIRQLHVHKFRGSDFVGGQHASSITANGFRVYPRLETRSEAIESVPVVLGERVATGIAALDEMVGGGLPRASATLAIGPTGTGKTSLALHFVCESTTTEPGLFLGFYEDPARLLWRAACLGLPLAERIDSGAVRLMWHPAAELSADEVIADLVDTIRSDGIKRIVIDGTSALEQAVLYRTRLGRLMTALTNTLRNLGVTGFYTAELPQLIGNPLDVRIGPLSAVAENIVLLRYAERDAQLIKMLTVMKMRDSDFSHGARRLHISAAGVDLLEWSGELHQDDHRPEAPSDV